MAATIPVTNPITAKPPSAGSDQVTDALMINNKRAIPVLLTTPLIVIASRDADALAIDFLKVSDCSAGFAVLILRCLFIFFDLLNPDPRFSIIILTAS
jgi:hypothetical protein